MNAVGSGNVNLPTGTLYGPHQAFTVQANGQLQNAAAYRPLIVAWRNGAPVRLQDLGNVVDDVENNKNAAWFQGERGVILGIQRQPGTNTVEVVEFFKSMKTVDGEISDYGWLSSIDKNGLSIEGVLVTFVRQDRPRSRLAMLTPDKSGIWKMDFAAFARSVKPSWEDLLTNKTDAGMVRVYVVKDNYYNGPFLNDKKWVAYALASPDMDEVLVGYCKPGTAQFRAMELMWSNGERSITRATLEIRRVAGADRRQFEIARVLAEDWVLGENPLDEAIK